MLSTNDPLCYRWFVFSWLAEDYLGFWIHGRLATIRLLLTICIAILTTPCTIEIALSTNMPY